MMRKQFIQVTKCRNKMNFEEWLGPWPDSHLPVGERRKPIARTLPHAAFANSITQVPNHATCMMHSCLHNSMWTVLMRYVGLNCKRPVLCLFIGSCRERVTRPDFNGTSSIYQSQHFIIRLSTPKIAVSTVCPCLIAYLIVIPLQWRHDRDHRVTSIRKYTAIFPPGASCRLHITVCSNL